MSKIEKLQITGVRSFDHKHGEVIKFFSPLTLIVGLNGSGKTTIIEALRYATTGELPPNSSTGGAWIHDPKLCGENEVLAQVKLAFSSSSGAAMIITRNLQVTVKKNTRTQKTLEASLATRHNGDRTVVSSRVAELNHMMPQYLGVSKAILESVIFCLQDESLWPMSAPLVLKKKFDEIFEAMKYTQAVENIKVIKKTQVAELEKHKLIMQHAQENKNKAARADAKARELTAQMDELRTQLDELQVRIREAREKSDTAWNHAAEFNKIVTDLNGKRIEYQATERSIQSLKQHMKVMSDSDDELRDMQDKYEERLILHQQERETQTQRYRELAKDLQINRDGLGSKQSEAGRYQAQKDQYERQIENRRDLIKETARRHDIRGFDSDINDGHVRDFMERISRLARDQQNAFERASKETQEEAQKAQQLLNSLNERRSGLGQTKASAASLIQGNDSKIFRLQTELNKIEIDEGGKTILESNIEDLESRLNRAKNDLATAEWDTKIQSTQSNLNTLEQSKEQLDAELVEVSRHAKDSAQLDFLRKALKESQQGLTTMTNSRGKKLAKLLGADWSPATLHHTYQTVLAEKQTAVKDAELQRDGTSRELEQINFKLSTNSADLDHKRQEMKDNEQAVRMASGGEVADYPGYLEELEAELEVLRQDNANFTSMQDYYEGSAKMANSQNCCRLCRRSFKAAEKTAFLNILKSMVTGAKKDEVAADLEKAENDYRVAKDARLSYDTFVRLEKEIPELESQRSALEKQRESLVFNLEQQDQIVGARSEEKRDVEFESKNVQNMHKSYTDICRFEAQIKDLDKLRESAGFSRGLEIIQEEQKERTEQIRSANTQLQQLRTDKDRSRTQINTLELEVRDVKARLAAAVSHLKEKTNLQTQIEDFKAQNSDQRNTVKRADEDIQGLIPKIAEAQTSLDDIRYRGDERNKALQKAASNLTDSLNQLNLAEREISAYIDRGGPQQLARAAREMAHFQDDIARIEEEQRRITGEVKKIDEILQSHSETKRAITDNLTYRENVKALEALKQQMDALSSHDAEADKDRLEREGKKWGDERSRLTAQHASVIGNLRAKDDIQAELIRDFDTDYKDAKPLYTEAKVRVQVTKAAIEDLGRYAGALDKAIMKYHSIKMEEINRIIDELWRGTYQGTDVDSIMIRSENETQKGNKSYNYRVVMLKADTEMDMRGRCSAGQKVLASIIIRLALAECFGIRCGLIALDEPTTNLDRDNIRALAESLAAIIRNRKQQANFQLVIITHDEEFLRYMNCSDFTDYYYRVDRTDDQCTRIRQQRIQDVCTEIGPAVTSANPRDRWCDP
jgi:DNA repair protein RAD50